MKINLSGTVREHRVLFTHSFMLGDSIPDLHIDALAGRVQIHYVKKKTIPGMAWPLTYIQDPPESSHPSASVEEKESFEETVRLYKLAEERFGREELTTPDEEYVQNLTGFLVSLTPTVQVEDAEFPGYYAFRDNHDRLWFFQGKKAIPTEFGVDVVIMGNRHSRVLVETEWGADRFFVNRLGRSCRPFISMPRDQWLTPVKKEDYLSMHELGSYWLEPEMAEFWAGEIICHQIGERA